MQILVAAAVASNVAAQPWRRSARRSQCCASASSGSRAASRGGVSLRVGSGGPDPVPVPGAEDSWCANSRSTWPPMWRAVHRGHAGWARWRRHRQSGAGTRSSGRARASQRAGCPGHRFRAEGLLTRRCRGRVPWRARSNALLSASTAISVRPSRRAVTGSSVARPSPSAGPPASGRTDSTAARGCRRLGGPVPGRLGRT
jgi:hypothetical protein